MTRCGRACALVCIAVLTGCGDERGPAATFSVRDSSGIRIVESAAPAWPEGDAWSVDPVPDLDLSGRDDEGLDRIGSVRLLGDGGIALFNGGACEVRIYSGTGELGRTVGRCGRGPGEFEDYASIWPWRADSLLVVDQLMRATVLGGDGTVGRVVRLPGTARLPIVFIRGVLEDGTLMVTAPVDPGARPAPGQAAEQVSLGVMRSLEDTVRVLGTWPGAVWEYRELDGRIGRNQLAFSSATQFAAGGTRIFAGLPDRYEIRVHDAAGALERIIRRAHEPVQVEQRDIDRLMERRLAEVDGAENQRAVRQAFRDLGHAERMPAFGVPVWPGGAEGGSSMLVDTESNLWVFVHYRPGEYRNDWSVFSPDGVWLGTVTLPEHLVPGVIGADRLIGTWTDETGFRHVRRHRIIK